jgi:hypothetical protein
MQMSERVCCCEILQSHFHGSNVMQRNHIVENVMKFRKAELELVMGPSECS